MSASAVRYLFAVDKEHQSKRSMANIVQFTTVHPRGDTRIRVKEVPALSAGMGESVVLCVMDGQGDRCDEEANVSVLDVGFPPSGRLARSTKGAWRMFRAVQRMRPAVAHFHDPELIPVGLALKLSGIRVIYDVHEDLPRQILGKHWIPLWLRWPVAWAAEAAERVAARTFDGIVTATPTIGKRFPRHKTVTVQNFPILSELIAPDATPYSERRPNFAYVGGISRARGAVEIVRAIGQVQESEARLQMAGNFIPPEFHKEVVQATGWQRVNFLGWASRMQVASILGQVRAGLVVLHPTPNYRDSLPVKMFEYMAAGLPVIASDFPLWRQIIEGAGCGVLVDPMDSDAIAEAMQWILGHSSEAEAMGQRGRRAVEECYNWGPEADKLVGLYNRLLGRASGSEV